MLPEVKDAAVIAFSAIDAAFMQAQYTAFHNSSMDANKCLHYSLLDGTIALGGVLMHKVPNAQSLIYRFICKYHAEQGFPPTVREICDGVGLSSPSTVHRHLSVLAERGLIKRSPNKSRSFSPVSKGGISKQPVPLLGKVAAGIPILAEENREDAFPIPQLLLHRHSAEEAFMLRVQGESMAGVGIHDGDILVVEQYHSPADGDIVVARVDREEVTVKRFFRNGKSVTLFPENPSFSPMVFSAGSVEILGKVTGLMRTY